MFASFQAAMGPGLNAGFQQGVYRRTYTGDFGGSPTWFATATKTATDKIIGSVNLGSVPTATSYEFLGLFKAPYTETFTFSLSSDDLSQLWVGDNAKAGNFNGGNILVSGGGSGTIALTKGGIYAFRLQYGNGPGPGNLILTVSSPSLTVTSDLTGLSFFNPNTQGI
jgi:hypothetical protein